MNVETLNKIINSDFKFKQYSSYRSETLDFENNISEFGNFVIYDDFKSFLQDNEHFIETEEGLLLDVDYIVENEHNFKMFMFIECFMSHGTGNLSFNDVSKPIIYGKAYDSEHYHLESIESFENTDDVLTFINEVLKDLGEVTHSTGVKNEYYVTDIVE